MSQNDDTFDTPDVSQEEFVARLERGEELKTYAHFNSVYTLSKRTGGNFFVGEENNARQAFATLTDALLAYGLLIGTLSEDPWKKHMREERL